MKLYKLLLGLLVVLCINSCATVFSAKKLNVDFRSNPGSANVTIIDQSGVVHYVGTTPCTVYLPNRNSYTVNFKLEGYKETTCVLSRSVNFWVLGDFLFSSLIPVAILIDVISSSFLRLYTDQVEVELTLDTNQDGSGKFGSIKTNEPNGLARYSQILLERK